MNRDAFFAAADALPAARLSDLLGEGGAVVVAPHPDDESLGCGALLREAVAAGRPVRIVFVSDGTGSHPNSQGYPADRLRALREGEAQAAMAALGVSSSQIEFLRLPDRAVPSSGDEAERASVAIANAAAKARAGVIFVTWRHDAHGDHQAAYAIARLAQRRRSARLFEYSIWGRGAELDREPEGPPLGWRLPSSKHRERKRAAILSHRSQVSRLIDDDPEGFLLPRAMIEDILARDELFLEMDP
ncbi:PIG-L deacetylase family protein [Roseiarcus sp.]|uniref:PIG-L deacetylase family protein n=1 Tax=Roseiarcus sp. TaxID=1969460 RepID=UPI003F94C0EB